jgi:hypothetical protein
MKKHIGLSIVFALVSTLTFAQASVAVGLKAGPNFAKIDANASAGENYKGRTGFHGGAFVLIKLSKIGIQPEVIFSKQGSKVNFDYVGIAKGTSDVTYNYINIPIILKLYTVAGINLQVGPQFGFLSGGEAKSTFTSYTTPPTTTTITDDAKDIVKSSDFSVALGAGWDLPLGITIDARYNLGLSKNDKSSSSTEEQKNQVFQVSVGYKLFKFGK